MNDTHSILKRGAGSFWLLVIVSLCVSSAGCASLRLNRRATIHRVKAKQHDTELAKSLHEKALKAAENNNWLKAEEWANQSVLADSDFGPAHNTLGTIFLQKEQLYHAAWEFEEASKLMPDNCEPLNNLGLVYEQAGKYENAYSYYQQGLEVSPGNIELSGNTARVRIILDDRGDDLEQLLSDLALSHPQKRWRSWARTQSEVRRFDEGEAWDYFNQAEHQLDSDWMPPTADGTPETPAFEVPESEIHSVETPELQSFLPWQPPAVEIENGSSSRLDRSN